MYYELLTGTPPFNGKSIEEFENNIHSGLYSLDLKYDLSLQGIAFINDCIQY